MFLEQTFFLLGCFFLDFNFVPWPLCSYAAVQHSTQANLTKAFFFRMLWLSEGLFLSSLSEPNSYQKKAGVRVEGSQLGQDFVHLRRILSESKLYQSSGLYGPDISQPREHRRDLLEGWVDDPPQRKQYFIAVAPWSGLGIQEKLEFRQ